LHFESILAYLAPIYFSVDCPSYHTQTLLVMFLCYGSNACCRKLPKSGCSKLCRHNSFSKAYLSNDVHVPKTENEVSVSATICLVLGVRIARETKNEDEYFELASNAPILGEGCKSSRPRPRRTPPQNKERRLGKRNNNHFLSDKQTNKFA